MTKQEALDYILVASVNEMSIVNKVGNVLRGKTKLRKSFNLSRSYKTLILTYFTDKTSWSQSVFDETRDVFKALDELVNQVIAKTLELKSLEKLEVLKQNDWIEFIPTKKGNYPDEYGQYLVCKVKGTIQYIRWGSNGWVDNSNANITHYMRIYKPII